MKTQFMSLVLSLCVITASHAQIVLWDTGPPHQVNFNGTDTFLGYSSGDLGAGSEQRWAAVPFRIEADNAVITQIDVDWFVVAGSEADNVNYIIWNRTNLDAPVDGDQFSSGVLGPYGVGIDDPRVDGTDDWLHQYAVDIPIPPGDYYLTIYGDGGAAPNNAAWLTGADLQDEALEQGFMWRSATFPTPGFEMYAPGTILPIGDQDPDDRWNPSFTLWGTGDTGPVCADDGSVILGTGLQGTVADACDSDDVYWAYHGSVFAFQISAPVTKANLIAAAPNGATDLTVSIEASKSSSVGTLILRAFLIDNNNNLVPLPGIMNLGTTDATQNFVFAGNLADFIDQDGNVTLRLETTQTSGLPNNRTRLDQVLFDFQ